MQNKKTTQVTSKISPMVQTSFARSPCTQLLFVVLFLIKVGEFANLANLFQKFNK